MRRSVTPKQVSALQKSCGLGKKRVRRCTQRDRRSCKQDFPDAPEQRSRIRNLEPGRTAHKTSISHKIRILFRCWQERTPYDELRYLKSLKKAAPPYSNTLPN